MLKHLSAIVLIVCAVFTVSPRANEHCELGTPVARYGAHKLWNVDGVFVYTTDVLNVDADGAPNAYRLDGKGLSFTCDGMVAIESGRRITPGDYPNTWEGKCIRAWTAARANGDYSTLDIFGLLKDEHGTPVVQSDSDPFPGEAFVSTTSMQLRDQPADTQRRYVDATAIPYIVLPTTFAGANLGSVAAVYRPKTGGVSFAVFADTGGELDEASIKLHLEIGGNPIVKINGVNRAKQTIDDRVIVAVFPNSLSPANSDADVWRASIVQVGQDALAGWGGEQRLKTCAQDDRK